MSKVFTSKEFIEKLKWLVNDVPNYYHSENGTWCNYNWNNNKFMMDCVVSIKGLLWGFKADRNKSHGGAIYLSNDVADFTANGGINYCTDVSSDFSKIEPGEYMCMYGTQYSHAGICLKSATPTQLGDAFECTTGWGVNRCVISQFDIYGNRYYNGVKNVASWTKFGKLIYIDYTTKKSNEEVAKEVIEGKYGNYPERKINLEREGYNYREVQNIVNDMMNNISKKLSVGTKVKAISTGNGASDGSSNTAKSGITGTITRIITGAKYPYLISNNGIPIGWYKETALKIL